VRRFGDAGGTRQRVVLVHGFTQTGASWERLAPSLTDHYEVLAPDAPGHGGSQAVRVAGIADTAALLVEAAGAGAYAGYSMGGRICLRAALDEPAAVRKLVLVSATAGIDDAGARAARAAEDGALADRLDPPAGTEETLTTAEFLEEWLARPLFAGLGGEAAGLEARLANAPEGLASSLRTVGTGVMAPLWERLGELRIPVLVVAGADDAKFVALGERIAAGIAGAELRVVPGAGHAVPFEQPDRFARLLRAFLDA
jgi:2-succinyl-6-hydroxy-2,4-cyclohexadiene-1-carboxylate synthase